MTALNPDAKAALRAAGITQADWARTHYPCNGVPGDLSTEIGRPVWHGDACGCTDDRCIGYHHDEGEDCGCLPALLDSYDGPRRARGASWRGKRVSDMTEAEIQRMAGAAPGIVKVRLSGAAGDVALIAGLLADYDGCGVEILDQSAPRANRRDPGRRLYLTVRVSADGGRP